MSAVAYPDLKTHILEHEWLQDSPGDINPLFTGGTTQYFFNQGASSRPCTLFYDGSIRLLPVQEVLQSQVRLDTGGDHEGASLWCHDWIGLDYFENQSYGMPEQETSFHVMTRFGIRGRDTLGTD